ncbi:MAG: hypothetical protein A3F18_02110 [Legionellales bacterium RIFCSPHIGHO2_12_FULL_37_14]|nr:MAG: hypothetical protein A3F18_02110 [Legionellales bacterium RIFCSPHIGHO2_12_FULL_37_14]
MKIDNYLAKQLQQFSLVDLSLVKLTYFVFGLFIYSFYPALNSIDWWLYLFLWVTAAMPLWFHMSSLKGNIIERSKKYIKTNNPSNQVLLFFSAFFFALMLGTLFPVIVSASWWVYFILLCILSIKPLTVTWCW